MSHEKEMYTALTEIERQLQIGLAELMKLAAENERLRAALREIAALRDVDADTCMWIAQHALDQT
jgi:regulator of replication initiation timing